MKKVSFLLLRFLWTSKENEEAQSCRADNLKAVSILGDRDTICAIVGGITIMSTDENKIPKDWISLVEKFETSIFCKKK
ncbi:MAG: hypothetical protein H6554_05910 [Chitinophagales bacterium]|nr:hypothetical protein [Chitinophagales bacterium]